MSTIGKKFGLVRAFIILSFIYGVLLLLVPFIQLLSAIGLFAIIASIAAINHVLQSKIINDKVDSKYRATTLSTFSMLVSIPYVLSAVLLGYLSDMYTVQNVIFVLGVFMIVVLMVSYIHVKRVND